MQSSPQGWGLQNLSGQRFPCLSSHIRQVFLYMFIWNLPCFDTHPFPFHFLLCISANNRLLSSPLQATQDFRETPFALVFSTRSKPGYPSPSCCTLQPPGHVSDPWLASMSLCSLSCTKEVEGRHGTGHLAPGAAAEERERATADQPPSSRSQLILTGGPWALFH